MTLRIIIRSNMKLEGSNHVDITYRTIDIDVPEVEAFLCAGGMNENSFLLREVVGVEALQNRPVRDMARDLGELGNLK